MEQEHQYMVCVSCMTYNHAPYITDALNGFTMQETTFPFVCTIVDDASTDGEQELIKNYLQEHFELEDQSIVRNEETEDYVLTFTRHKTNKNCYFAVLYLKYNHYSVKKTKIPYVAEWRENCKYIALCEGDDYWIVSDKLQKQVGFMESHSKCTMTCNRTKLFSVRDKKYVGEQYCRKKDGFLNPVDVINRTGLYIPTCSIVYRPSILDNYPVYCKKCKVGDYPLQIMAAMKGEVYYFDINMSVYRVNNSDSWMGRQQWGRFSENRMAVLQSQIDMFRGFSVDYPAYHRVFTNKIADHINRNIPSWRVEQTEIDKYLSYWEDEVKNYGAKVRLDLFLQTIKIPKIGSWYRKCFMRKYLQMKKLY